VATYIRFTRGQSFPLSLNLKDWVPEDDRAHFVVAEWSVCRWAR
jgi:hypothetical protein